MSASAASMESPIIESIPLVLKGWQRTWDDVRNDGDCGLKRFAWKDTLNVVPCYAFANITPKPSSDVFGVMHVIESEFLENFDHRERGLSRTRISVEDLRSADGSRPALPSMPVFVYHAPIGRQRLVCSEYFDIGIAAARSYSKTDTLWSQGFARNCVEPVERFSGRFFEWGEDRRTLWLVDLSNQKRSCLLVLRATIDGEHHINAEETYAWQSTPPIVLEHLDARFRECDRDLLPPLAQALRIDLSVLRTSWLAKLIAASRGDEHALCEDADAWVKQVAQCSKAIREKSFCHE